MPLTAQQTEDRSIRVEPAHMLTQDSAVQDLDSVIQDFSFRVVRTRCHDEFERRVDECRRLAAAARNESDRAFWLGLVERWQAVENRRPILIVPRRRGKHKSEP
jgi:hypothetical protein